jgi:hypothetical protein
LSREELLTLIAEPRAAQAAKDTRIDALLVQVGELPVGVNALAQYGAHLLRDLRGIGEADPAGQLWAKAMADTLLQAHLNSYFSFDGCVEGEVPLRQRPGSVSRWTVSSARTSSSRRPSQLRPSSPVAPQNGESTSW